MLMLLFVVCFAPLTISLHYIIKMVGSKNFIKIQPRGSLSLSLIVHGHLEVERADFLRFPKFLANEVMIAPPSPAPAPARQSVAAPINSVATSHLLNFGTDVQCLVKIGT